MHITAKKTARHLLPMPFSIYAMGPLFSDDAGDFAGYQLTRYGCGHLLRDGDALAHHLVEEGGLADIRPADDGNEGLGHIGYGLPLRLLLFEKPHREAIFLSHYSYTKPISVNQIIKHKQ